MRLSEAQSRFSSERVSLYFNITNTCNSACVFCASDNQDMPCHELTTHVICSAFERFGLGSGDEIIINGGEPTIHTGLQSILQQGADRGARIILFTNGRLFQNFEYAKALLGTGVFRVSIPLYAHSNVIHDRLTCIPGSFKQTLQGIRNVFAIRSLTGYPTQIELKLLATRPGLPEWVSIADLIAMELGYPDQMVLSGLILSKRVLSHRDELIPTISELRQHVNDTLDRLWRWGIPTLLWSVPLCVLNDCNLARYRKIAWEIKYKSQEIYFDPNWKRQSSMAAPFREIYFDPNYPDGIELASQSVPIFLESCRKCAIASVCDDENAFFAEVFAISAGQQM